MGSFACLMWNSATAQLAEANEETGDNDAPFPEYSAAAYQFPIPTLVFLRLFQAAAFSGSTLITASVAVSAEISLRSPS